jgi:uncharacterized membrane protein YhaH (DUF805 family)
MGEEARFNIVFDGLIVVDKPEQTVKENLAQLFKCDMARVDGLFCDRSVVIKRDVSEAAANRYIKALLEAGAIARKESASSGPPQPSAPAVAAPPPLEEITARMDAAEGFTDLFLSIVKVSKKGDSHFYEARGLYHGEEVGLRFAIRSSMPAGVVDGQPSQDGFVREAVRMRSTGPESDRFVRALGELYGFPTDQPFTRNVVKTTAFSLNEAPVDMETPGHYKFKLFFEEGNEELYSELFLNFNTAENIIEFREKDTEYRKPLIRTLTKAPDLTLQPTRPREKEESPYAPPTQQVLAAIEAERKDTPEYCELNIIGIEGRLGRVRYLGWSVAALLLFVPFIAIAAFLMQVFMPLGLLAFIAIYGALFVFNISVGVRRLHDISHPGYLLLLLFIPFIGPFFSLYLLLRPGDDGENDFGPPPPPNSTGVTLLAGLGTFAVVVLIIAVIVAQ